MGFPTPTLLRAAPPFRIVLLAAGQGTRMGALVQEAPKALLPIEDGRSITQINLDNLQRSGTDAQVVLVGGYHWERVLQFAATSSAQTQLQAVYNPAFAAEGPLRSVEIGLREAGPDAQVVAIANGDTVFSPSLFSVANAVSDARAYLVISADSDPDIDDVRVSLDPRGRILSAEKQPQANGPGSVSAGFLILRGADLVAQAQTLAVELLEDERASRRHMAWHSLVGALVDAGVEVEPILAPRSWWSEFDSPEAINRYQAELRRQERAAS